MDLFTYFFLVLLFCLVCSDMPCICILYAVAHTQSHFSHSLHYSNFHCACLLPDFQHSVKMMIWTRAAGRTCSAPKNYSAGVGIYDPNTRPTLFFTTPVNICPPRPPIDQLEETTL